MCVIIIWKELASGLQRRSRLKMLTDGRQIPAFGSGELKKAQIEVQVEEVFCKRKYDIRKCSKMYLQSF